MAEDMEIDDSLYSRQRYVLGDSAMLRMAKSSILIVGLGGLGVEIAKNIVLAGVKSLTVQDHKLSSIQDLASQFFIRESDVITCKNRAEACSGRLIELNPYVSILVKTQPLTCDTDLTYLTNYQCVILSECALETQLKVNEFCRSQDPQIKFISTDVFGIFGMTFIDFGNSFDVVDPNGEEPKDIFISDITKGNPGVVTCLEDRVHALESGDIVTFREVKGMTAVNGQQFTIKVISPYKFSIGDTSSAEFEPYIDGGIFTEVKVPKKMTFGSLVQQLKEPSLLTPDLSKPDAPIVLHIAYLALQSFQQQHGHLPRAWDDVDVNKFLSIAKTINSSLKNKVDVLDENLLLIVSRCSSGCLAPLCAVFGGTVAQEALKALTGKFTPLNQWLYLDASEVVPQENIVNIEQFSSRGDRYDPLRICIGQTRFQLLADTRLFMVGCGAIGCEMLKNYALLGLATASGKITITDNDLIEKSNLNRQFLFRPHHIQKPKSVTAGQAALEINKDVKIEALQQKVCPDTEESVFTDEFFESQHIIVNALDNVEARRYMDGYLIYGHFNRDILQLR